MDTVVILGMAFSQAFFFKEEQRWAHVPGLGYARGINATLNNCDLPQSLVLLLSPVRVLHERVDIKGKGNVKQNWKLGETQIFPPAVSNNTKIYFHMDFYPKLSAEEGLKISTCASESRVNYKATVCCLEL